MTNRNYYTSSNYVSTAPTREEFHRYASNIININDFETDHSNGIQIEKVAISINWTIKNDKKRFKYTKKERS